MNRWALPEENGREKRGESGRIADDRQTHVCIQTTGCHRAGGGGEEEEECACVFSVLQ